MSHTTWRCYHCGFVAKNKEEAAAHFGDDEGLPPLCLTWVELTKKEKIAEFQQLVVELEQTRKELIETKRELECMRKNTESI